MAKPKRTPLVIEKPVFLSAKLITEIGDRIETIAPIETTDSNAPVQVIYGQKNGGLGAEIKGNMVAREATICIDGVSTRVTVYCKPES